MLIDWCNSILAIVAYPHWNLELGCAYSFGNDFIDISFFLIVVMLYHLKSNLKHLIVDIVANSSSVILEVMLKRHIGSFWASSHTNSGWLYYLNIGWLTSVRSWFGHSQNDNMLFFKKKKSNKPSVKRYLGQLEYAGTIKMYHTETYWQTQH